MYAVIKTGGKQYRVAENDLLEVERLAGEAGDIIEITDVLMVGTDKGVEVGTPLVDGATVAAELVAQTRGDKIIIFKKKRRKHYRRKNGHRQDLTALRITEILTGGKKPSKKAAAKAEEKPAKKAAAKAEEKPAKKEAAKAEEKPAKKAAAKPAKKAAEKPKAKSDDKADDLTQISGVGPVIVKKLEKLGYTTFAQIAEMTPEQIADVDEKLNFKGRIEREDWIAQAKKLAKA